MNIRRFPYVIHTPQVEMAPKKTKTLSDKEKVFKEKLTIQQYRIMRQKGTEPAFTGKYWEHHEKGDYRCAACGAVLFSSDAKFDSNSGWPSFTDPANKKAVAFLNDLTFGMKRVEVICKKCKSHLGHVFDDGPRGKQRYCINSACLNFIKK